MGVIVECSLPASDFELGEALQENEYTQAELERLVATGTGKEITGITLFMWVADTNTAALGTTLKTTDRCTSVRLLDEFDDRALFRVGWETEPDGFVGTLLDLDVAIVEAIGRPDRWRFQLRFHTEEALSTFRATRQQQDARIDIQRVAELAEWETEPPPDAMGLTSGQHEALLTALDAGYFSVPRGTNLVDLSDELGVSSQSLSERLRRGEAKVMAATLGTKPNPESELE